MKNKRIIIICVVITLVIVGILSFFLLTKTSNKVTEQNLEKLETKTINNIATLEDENITQSKFEKILGKETHNIHIVAGQDSYLRNKLSNKLIKKYNLQNYVKLQKELADKVEEKYLSNLTYEVISSDVEDNKVCQTIEITTYYYALYLNDLLDLVSEMTEGTIEDAEQNEKDAVDYYKMQVLAMKVLDNHLDDYENTTNEISTTKICYTDGKTDSDEMLGLIAALNGENYNNFDYSKQENIDASKARLNKYLEEAKNITI